ncbi:PIG-L deacetylase family protein [Candidatus Pelagibacter sp. HIMB1748]|uniref:PIG-L deacetylase family protein n=1 Tax=unclassified Candidatus Pelagibacter TaxID=2647897 RepID=UPI003F86C54A
MKYCVVAPHLDDETFGCGGLLLELKKRKKNTYLIVVGKCDENILKKIKFFYNFREIILLNIEPTKFNNIGSKEISLVKKFINKNRITHCFIPNKNDIHSDHYFSNKLCLASLKWFRAPSVKNISVYEVPSETGVIDNHFSPNFYVDIKKHIKKKLQILKIFKSEIENFPFPRSYENVMALSKFRGSQSGYLNAEAFKIIYKRDL